MDTVEHCVEFAVFYFVRANVCSYLNTGFSILVWLTTTWVAHAWHCHCVCMCVCAAPRAIQNSFYGQCTCQLAALAAPLKLSLRSDIKVIKRPDSELMTPL